MSSTEEQEASRAQGRWIKGAGRRLVSSKDSHACHQGLATLARAEGWVGLGDGVAHRVPGVPLGLAEPAVSCGQAAGPPGVGGKVDALRGGGLC